MMQTAQTTPTVVEPGRAPGRGSPADPRRPRLSRQGPGGDERPVRTDRRALRAPILLITANQPFSEWGKIFPDAAMTLAAIDRLVHHATSLEMNVESYRRKEAIDKARGRSSAGLGQGAGDDAATAGLARPVLARGLQPDPDLALRRGADSAGLARRETRGPASARMVADRMAEGRARATNTRSRPCPRTRRSKYSRHRELPWGIERDYEELKSELGLAHFEGRGWRGFHHHATLCIAAYGFLIRERAAFPPQEPGSAKALSFPVVHDPEAPRSDPSDTSRTRSPPCESD